MRMLEPHELYEDLFRLRRCQMPVRKTWHSHREPCPYPAAYESERTRPRYLCPQHAEVVTRALALRPIGVPR